MRSIHPLRQYVGAQIKQARRARGLTVYALSKRTGISTTHLYGIEDGHASPSLAVLDKLFSELGLYMEVMSYDDTGN